MKVPPKRKGNNFQDSATLLQGERLNESPSEKEGKLSNLRLDYGLSECLNESPSEKEGKWSVSRGILKRAWGLNESPSEKEGKLPSKSISCVPFVVASMKVPPKRKGNPVILNDSPVSTLASMKVPPKRKGNPVSWLCGARGTCLNESPSEKEGK